MAKDPISDPIETPVEKEVDTTIWKQALAQLKEQGTQIASLLATQEATRPTVTIPLPPVVKPKQTESEETESDENGTQSAQTEQQTPRRKTFLEYLW